MERYIPVEKLSKKKRRELAARQRRGWGGISPVTRKPPNPRAYNRKKTPRWDDGSSCRGGFFCGAERQSPLRTSLPMDL